MMVIQLRMSLLVLCVLFVTIESSLEVVKCSQDNNETKIYALSKGWAKEISDSKTVEHLGFSIDNLESISEGMLLLFRKGPILDQPPIYPLDQTFDELTRAELAMIDAFQTPLIYGMQKLGEYINPSVVKWKGRTLLATGLAWGIVEGGKAANENTEFQWHNNSYFPFFSSDDYLGISTKVNPLNKALTGQDPRFAHIDENRLFLAYTNRFSHRIRMGMAELVFNDTTGTVSLENVHSEISPPEGTDTGDQKNWSPFVYNGTILMIQSINPLHVVRLDDYSADTSGGPINSYTMSFAPEMPLFFSHGHLRGGTNAILVGDVYLALFHTTYHIPGNFLKTYWMGAYTFSAHPPFTLISVSPYPIVHKRFLEGPWDPLKNRQIDYCVFPMSIFLEPAGETEAQDTVYVSYGYNDHEGWIAKMRLKSILDSLEPVDYV